MVIIIQEFKRIFTLKLGVSILVLTAISALMFYQNNKEIIINNQSYSTQKVYHYYDLLLEDYHNKCNEMAGEDAVRQTRIQMNVLRKLAVLDYYKDTDDLSYENENHESEIENVKNSNPELYKQYLLLKETKPEVLKQYALDNEIISSACTIFDSQVNYSTNYYSKISDAIDYGNEMLSTGVFSQANTFGHMNILKTKFDYRRLLSIKVQPDNTKAIDAIVNSSEYINIFVLLLLITVVSSFFYQRKMGLWEILYATPKGRCNLELKRIGIIFALSLGITVFMYTTMLMIAFGLYSGFGNLSGALQNSQQFFDVNLIISKWQFVILFEFMSAMGAFFTSLVIWIIISIVSPMSIGVGCSVAVLGGTYLLYDLIPEKSIFVFLKFINLWSGIRMGSTMGEYCNWGFGSFITDKYISTTIFMILGIFFLCIIIIINGQLIKPNYSIYILKKIAEMFSEKIGFLKTLFPIFLQEIYKIMWLQKGIVVVILVTIIAWNNQIERGYLFHSDMSVAIEYYNETDGMTLGNDLYGIVEIYEKKEKELQETYQKISQSLDAGEDIYIEQDLLNCSHELKLYNNGVSEIHRNINNLEKLNKKGISGTVVSPFVLEDMLGESLFDNQRLYSFLSVISVILLTFGVYSYEKHENMMKIIHSSVNGRKKWFVRKQISSFICVLLMWIILSWINWSNISYLYNMKDYDVLIQNYPIMSSFPIFMTVKEYFVFMYLFKLLLMLNISCITSLISCKAGYRQSLILSSLLLVPHMMLLLGVKQFYYGSIVAPLCITEMWVKNQNDGMMYLIWEIWIMTGMISIIFSGKRIMKYMN